MDTHEFDLAGSMLRGSRAAGDTLIIRDVSENENPSGVKDIQLGELLAQMIESFTGAAAGTLALTKTTGTKYLTKATAGAYTLAVPTAAEEGNVIRIISKTAAAHTIATPSTNIDAGVSAAKTTITLAAYVGANVTLQAVNLRWVVVASQPAVSLS